MKEKKKGKGCGLSLTWEVSMDGMCDASGSLQGDVVQKHGSLLHASPHASERAADAPSPAQN